MALGQVAQILSFNFFDHKMRTKIEPTTDEHHEDLIS